MERLKKKGKHADNQFAATSAKDPFFGVQAKLQVNKPGDAFEVEADRTADKIVNNSNSLKNSSSTSEPTFMQRKPDTDKEQPAVIQQKNADEEQPVQKVAEAKEDDKAVQKKEDEKKDDAAVQKKEEEEQPVQKVAEAKEDDKAVQKKEEEKKVDTAVQKKEEEEQSVQKVTEAKEDDMPVQKKEEDSEKKGPAAPTIEEKLKSRKGKGSPLSKEVKAEMDREFKTNFRDVRIHTDKEAQELAHSLGAQAFTYGTDIYFNAGKYNPTTQEGKFLLAHELTHVVQQRNSPGLLKND